MENLNQLMAGPFSSAKDASEKFDKKTLLQLHEFGRQQRVRVGAGSNFQLQTSGSSSGGGAACSVPLERLIPISFKELKVGAVHKGRVVYGTLCAEAFRISGIMTVLEDDKGLAVRLSIYNAAHSQTNIKMLYPMGAKVAIREPYFKRAVDCSLGIRVDNPANVEILVPQKEKRAENLPYVDVEEVRKKGNSCFRDKEWDAAAEHYTKCIDAALLQLNQRSSNDNNDMKTCLLLAYSNRAETSLQVREFELALEDSNKALGIDSGNLKALYRRGRALLGMRQYAEACKCLEKAKKASPGQREIQDDLHRARTLYAQNRNGKYDISDWLLGRSPPPEVADFVGPVEIKMTENGRGRGLYATREISTGQLLLVSNAVAVCYEDGHSTSATVLNVDHRGKINTASQEDLVAVVVSAAMKSQILLRQLYSLAGSSAPGSLDVPAVESFKTDGHMSGQEEEEEKLQVDVKRIRDIIALNSFGGAEQTFASKSKIYEAKLVQRGQDFSGLWLLPSFINHSCLPNSSRMDVGSAMFIHASKPIKRGEEITISYFDTLVPLPQRQAMYKNWGFKCKCRRCILELSLKAALDPITTRFEELHDKALEEINAARSQERFQSDLPACAEFAKLFAEAEEIIRDFPLLKTNEEKNWIRASFASAYFAGMQSDLFFPTMLEDGVPSGEGVMQAIQNTVPGDIRTLVMAARAIKGAQRWMGDEKHASIIKFASEQAREACIRVFGKHREDVLEALVVKYSK